MKNAHKGFALSLLLIIVAVLLIGGGAYVYEKNKQVNQSQQILTCIDSGHSKDIYTKGWAETIVNASAKNVMGATTDACATHYNNTAEYEDLPSCSGNDCYVKKAYCGTYQGSPIDESEFIQCPHGCTNGACIRQ